MRASARASLRGVKFLWLMNADHPEIGQEFEAMMVELAQTGASEEVVTARSTEFGRTLTLRFLPEYMARASEASLGSFVSAQLVVMDRMNEEGGEDCAAWLFPDGSAPPAMPAFEPSEATRMNNAMAEVISSAATSPQGPTDPERAKALATDLVQRLYSNQGPEFVASLVRLSSHEPEADRATACQVVAVFYREALATPDGARGELLRGMLGRKQPAK